MSSRSGSDSFDFKVTRRSGSGNGSGRRRTALTTEKIAVFAPTPSASVMTAAAVKPGRFASARAA